MPVSVELIRSLGACWSPAQLAQAEASWPSPTPSWAWFLGERLQPMSRAEAMLRVQVALGHIAKARLEAPERPRVMADIFSISPSIKFAAACNALGAWLDAQDEPSFAALAAALDA